MITIWRDIISVMNYILNTRIGSAIVAIVIFEIARKLFVAVRRPYPNDKFDYWIRKLFKVRNLKGKSIEMLENFSVNDDTIGLEELEDLIEQFKKRIKDKIKAEGLFSKSGPSSFNLNFVNIENLYHGSLDISAKAADDEENDIQSFVISIKANDWKFKDTDTLIQSMIELLKDGEAFFAGSGKISPDNFYDISLELNREPVIYTYISKISKSKKEFATIKLGDSGIIVKISGKRISFDAKNFQGSISEKIKETLIWYV